MKDVLKRTQHRNYNQRLISAASKLLYDKGIIFQAQCQLVECDKIFTNYRTNRGLVYRTYKNLKSTDQKEYNPILKMGYRIMESFSEKETQKNT